MVGPGTAAPAQCPLCSSAAARLLATVEGSRIWDALERDLGARFSEGVRNEHASGGSFSLLECETCGLHYFDPLIAGSGDFYRELTASVSSYYIQDKWDFSSALTFMRPGTNALDVACGAGSFVARARAAGIQATGIDTNPAAVQEALDRGLPVECVSLDEFSHSNARRFDTVSAFQVIEHIDGIVSFARSAATCVKPGGHLILTVPNRLRRFRDAFEPLDHPPHHLSRWTAAQLAEVAKRSDLRVATIRHEPASMHDCRAVLRAWLAGSAGADPDSTWSRALARAAFGPLSYRFYKSAGLIDRWQLWRMSVMAVLLKPA